MAAFVIMTIWVRLGISVAVAAMFCIVTSAFLQGTSFYEQFRWHLCGVLLGVGPMVFLIGRKVNAQFAAAAAPAGGLVPGWASESPESREPFLLFNLAYWGVMMMVFGGIIALIVPRSEISAEAGPPPEPQVAARTVLPEPEPEPVVFPELTMQGLVFRPGKSSVIFDGNTYEVGEVVQGAKVAAITAEQVTLELRGERKVYHLERELLKRLSRF